MKDRDDIFSSEALRHLRGDQGSLDAQAVDMISSRELSNTARVLSTLDTVPEGRYSPSRSGQQGAPWHSFFPASTEQGSRHRRAKFEDPKRRAEVAQVRKEGAS